MSTPGISSSESRQIPGFEGRYSATADGLIWSHISRRFLSMAPNKDGYLYVALRRGGLSINVAVHRLVCSAWKRAPLEGEEANHDDLIKTNNRASNLGWMTPKENTAHALANLPQEVRQRMRAGRRAARVKLNRTKRTLAPRVVSLVHRLAGIGSSQAAISRLIGRSRNTVARILKGETYVD